MRRLLKILLFPLRLMLGVVIGVCRFFCACSSAVLFILSGILFLLSLIALLIEHTQAGILGMVGALLLSPFGLPKAAGWMIDRMDDFRRTIRAI